MLRTQITISKEDYDAAKAEAARLGISLAEFVRRAVRGALPADESQPWMSYAGMVESGDPASSRHIDDLVYGHKPKAYVDTSALIAFADRSDSYHTMFRRLFGDPPRLLTTTLVVAEGHGWFLRRYDRTRALQFLAMIEAMTPLRVLAGRPRGAGRRNRRPAAVLGPGPDDDRRGRPPPLHRS